MTALLYDDCQMAKDWLLDPHFAYRLRLVFGAFTGETGRDVQIISGHRTCEEQQRLQDAGRPAAPCELSNHVLCPALAVDIRIEGLPTPSLKTVLGRIVTLERLRWGGGSRVDPKTSIPEDWNHIDTGPRTDAVAEKYRKSQGTMMTGG